MPDTRRGRLNLLPWPPERTESAVFWKGDSEVGPQLVVVSAGVAATAVEAVPDATPVVYRCTHVPGEDVMAMELARRTARAGGLVTWLESPDAADPYVGARVCEAPEGGLAASFREEGIDCDPAGLKFRPTCLGQNWVLLARPRRQLGPTVQRLRTLGAVVISQPAIAIGPPVDPGPLDTAIDRLDQYDWLVFSSANGVHSFVDRLWAHSADLRRLGRARLAAIGPGTAEALGEYRLQADVVPDQHRAEALAEALAADAPDKRFLLARASRGRDVLAERLSSAGAHVEQVIVYQSTDVDPGQANLWPVQWLLDLGRIQWTVVTSSAIARSLERLFGERLKKTRLASISPITSQTLRELGLEPTVEAERYTLDGVIEAMAEHPPY